jgi:hypothetical protein
MYWKANPDWIGQPGLPFAGKNFAIITENQGISWMPNRPLPGTSCTITYDPTGGPLEGQAEIGIWWWVDGMDGLGGGSGGTVTWPGDAMTSNAPNEWVYTFTIPPNTQRTVNFLFNNNVPSGTIKDENFEQDMNYLLFVGP